MPDYEKVFDHCSFYGLCSYRPECPVVCLAASARTHTGADMAEEGA